MIDAEKIEWTTAELATIEFRLGDMAVLMFPKKLSHDQLISVMLMWEKVQPGIKGIVLDDGARLGLIREVPNG